MLQDEKCEQTFLRLVLLCFSLIIEAQGTLVNTISLHTVPPSKPSGVVYTVVGKRGGVR